MKGFTFLEIMIVIVILALLFSVGFIFNLSFYQTFLLQGEQRLLLNLLHKVRLEALDNLYSLPRGVYIDENNYIIFSGSSFANRIPAYDLSYPRSAVKIQSPFNEIIFSPLSATTTASGTIELSLNDKKFFIIINNEGFIDW